MNRTKLIPRMLVLGDCLQCGEPVVVHVQKGVSLSAYANEEFCSSVCSRKYNGVVMPSDPKPKPANA